MLSEWGMNPLRYESLHVHSYLVTAAAYDNISHRAWSSTIGMWQYGIDSGCQWEDSGPPANPDKLGMWLLQRFCVHIYEFSVYCFVHAGFPLRSSLVSVLNVVFTDRLRAGAGITTYRSQTRTSSQQRWGCPAAGHGWGKQRSCWWGTGPPSVYERNRTHQGVVMTCLDLFNYSIDSPSWVESYKLWCWKVGTSYFWHAVFVNNIKIRVPPNFGFGKFEIRQFFPNSAKFGFGQISGRIWQTPMQLQCVQLVT